MRSGNAGRAHLRTTILERLRKVIADSAVFLLGGSEQAKAIHLDPAAVIRIAITAEAFAAIEAKLPIGSAAAEPQTGLRDTRRVLPRRQPCYVLHSADRLRKPTHADALPASTPPQPQYGSAPRPTQRIIIQLVAIPGLAAPIRGSAASTQLRPWPRFLSSWLCRPSRFLELRHLLGGPGGCWRGWWLAGVGDWRNRRCGRCISVL
jgi:hypothetical protein